MRHKNKKVITLIVLGLFLLPLFNPVVEGMFPFSDDTTDLKTSASTDFHAISESDNPTRWILQGAEISPVEDFHDDINTDYWNLVDVSANSFEKWISASSDYLLDNKSLESSVIQYTGTHFNTGVQDGSPFGMTYDGTYLWVLGTSTDTVYKYTTAGVYASDSFYVGGQDSLPQGIAWDGTNFWMTGSTNDEVYKYTSAGVYTGTHFDISTYGTYPRDIEWDGTYLCIVIDGGADAEVYKYTTAGVYSGIHFDTDSQDTSPNGIVWDGSYYWTTGDVNNKIYQYTAAGAYTGYSIATQDTMPMGIDFAEDHLWVVGNPTTEVYKYEPKYDIFKNYFGSGYMYMQSDTTELIGLKSQDYTTHYNLSSGDYFEVDFQIGTVAQGGFSSQIDLILLKDGEVNKTLTLSQSGSTNYNRHTVQISVDEYVEFDQLKISLTSEDKDYIKVWDVKTFKYSLTGDYADFNVGSKSTRMVNLTADTYNLRIFDPYDGEVKVDTNITIEAPYDDYLYIPTETIDCRLSLFNIGKESSLNFIDYHIEVNRSLNGEWDVFDLLNNIFTADVGTHVYVNVSDRFDTLIDSFDKVASSYIDLELDVYQLQIKNLMTEGTTLDVNSTYTYPLLSGNFIDFILSKAYYQIGYYDTNDVYKQFTIFLDSNQAYELNRSQICFLSYTDEQGNHLFFEDYKTYLNGSLIYEKVFYEEIGTDVHINITDRYGINLYTDIYTVLVEDNYIPIILYVYELKLKNMQNEFNYVNITRAPYPIVGTVGDIVESGHYPATYSFTDEAVGTSGTDIDWVTGDLSGSTASVSIVSDFQNHKKVIKATNDNPDNVRVYNTFTAQEESQIEFWMATDDVSIAFSGGIWITNDGYSFASSNIIFMIEFHTNNIRIRFGDGAGGISAMDLIPATNNVWYHIKIDLNFDTDRFTVYVNGISYGSHNFVYDNDFDNFDTISIYNEADADYSSYFDAIGYSWNDYNIGDNLHDSYYLGSETFEAYNQTEIGDYTGTESFDYNTEEGVFYGTYDFRDEEVKTYNNGDEADAVSEIAFCDLCSIGTDDGHVDIIAAEDGHKKVVKLTNTNASVVYFRNTFTAKASGTIELWIKGAYGRFYIGDDTQTLMLLIVREATNLIYLYYGNGVGGSSSASVAYAGDWMHVKFVFDCATDTYDGYINGIKIVDGENFYQDYVSAGITQTQPTLEGGNSEGFYDAIGYSWDTTSHSGLGYDEGRNVNSYDLEPLLESDFFDYLSVFYGSQVRILSELAGHKNVLETYSNAIGTYRPNIYNYFSGGETGTVEFWVRQNNGRSYINLGGNKFQLHITGNVLYYHDGSTYQTILNPFNPNQWYHIKLVYDCNGGINSICDVYVDGVLEVDNAEFRTDVSTIDRFYIYHSNVANNYIYFDGIGYSVDSNYNVGDNVNSHGQGVIDELEAEGWTITNEVFADVGISGEYNSHKKFLNLTDDNNINDIEIFTSFTSQTSGVIEFYIKTTAITEKSQICLADGSNTKTWFYIQSSKFQYYDGVIKDIPNVGQPPMNDVWYHIKIDFDCTTDKIIYTINGISSGELDFAIVSDDINRFYFYSDVGNIYYSTYIDAIAYSWISGYYVGDNYNFYDCDSEYMWTTNIAPDEIVSFKLLKGFYNIWMVNSEETISYSFRMFDDNYFVLNSSQMCFLSYTNQRGNYLEFNQFKTYWNGTLLYENVFYERNGRNVSIEIKDHYDISIKNHTFVVSSGDNYVPIVLTMYSLKAMNQQEIFNHINISRDPNYYDSPYSWSEWIAPSEIIEFELFAGYYKINLTNNEAGSSNLYSYTLNGDDILLISSDNTIYNVLLNIANVNTTIGNQITNVQIDLTNQNSNINNSIINIDINLGNINSTLGNMLVNLDVDITNIANNISNLYTFTENSFVNLGNNINTSFISIENNIISINQSISNLVIGVSNDIYLVNGTISTMISSLETNLLLMNLSIDTALFDLDTTVVQIGNNITSNYILLNNSITLANNNINDSRIAIINNLALINNTISNLISQVYSSVYMINNSIYTAVVDVGTSLMLVNNSILGNLSIVLQMNDALTELYRKTMFSALLNWTDIGYNTSLITSQIDAWDFINHYKNQSIEVHLRFQDIVDKLVVTANNYKTQWLPNYDTEYRLWSIKDQEYLEPWKPLPENKTVDFGFYEEDVSLDPLVASINNVIIVVFAFLGIILIIVGVVLYLESKLKKSKKKNYKHQLKPTSFDRSLVGGR